MKQAKDEEEDEEVVAEADVYLLANGQLGCVNRIQFHGQQSTSSLSESIVRFKPQSKVLQLSMQRECGIEGEKKKSLYQGNAKTRHHSVNTVLGYFDDGRLYLMPMADTYEMNYTMPPAIDESGPRDAKRSKSAVDKKNTALAPSSSSGTNGLEAAGDGDGEAASANGKAHSNGEKPISEPWLDLALEMVPPTTILPQKTTSMDNDEEVEAKRMKLERCQSPVMNGLL